MRDAKVETVALQKHINRTKSDIVKVDEEMAQAYDSAITTCETETTKMLFSKIGDEEGTENSLREMAWRAARLVSLLLA